MYPDLRLFIDGQWRKAADDLAVVNPATEEEIGRLPCAARSDLDDALDAAVGDELVDVFVHAFDPEALGGRLCAGPGAVPDPCDIESGQRVGGQVGTSDDRAGAGDGDAARGIGGHLGKVVDFRQNGGHQALTDW